VGQPRKGLRASADGHRRRRRFRAAISDAGVGSPKPYVSEALSRRFVKDRFETASDAEQRYLAAMADLGDGPVRSADVALRAAYKERGSTSVLRESLLRKDLVYSPRHGLIDFTVPLSGGVSAQHPLASFTDEL
jgi:hypothetical protein